MYNIKFKLPDLGVYKPLAVIGMILCLVSFRGADDIHGYMLNFMAGFFIIFATFKLFDLNAFQNAFSKYDIVAEKYPLYGYFYPFIELILGLAFLYRFLITVALFLVLVIMSIGCVGVIKALVKGEKLTLFV
ncbi:MauE/DoxX family redox-associated membrane protein [Bartonella sp. DGB1]|uniref:MauE/DoxX family redox-associated membrane protein n=1 Tax=Bartonella sp. DGB1 TaxID=3239807 RepID=UPI00352430A0